MYIYIQRQDMKKKYINKDNACKNYNTLNTKDRKIFYARTY
jgi:hypothetical protein